MKNMYKKCCGCTDAMYNVLSPVWALIARVYLFLIFYKSGILKVKDILGGNADRVVFLFQDEYKLPFPELLAYTTSFVEVIAAVLILFGLFSRLSALILFVMALFIQLTYIQHVSHILWIFLSSYVLIYGPGKYSIDRLWCCKDANYKKASTAAKKTSKPKAKAKAKPKAKRKTAKKK